VKFGTQERMFSPLSLAKFHVYRCNVNLWTTILSENNTGMAALRTDLPVIKHFIILLVMII